MNHTSANQKQKIVRPPCTHHIFRRPLSLPLTVVLFLFMFPSAAFAAERPECMHTHDADYGYVAAVEEVPCDMGCTDTDGSSVLNHIEGCA